MIGTSDRRAGPIGTYHEHVRQDRWNEVRPQTAMQWTWCDVPSRESLSSTVH